MSMSKEEVFAFLDKLVEGDGVQEDEFTALEYSRQKGISFDKARSRLGQLEDGGLVSSRIIYRHGRRRVWKLTDSANQNALKGKGAKK